MDINQLAIGVQSVFEARVFLNPAAPFTDPVIYKSVANATHIIYAIVHVHRSATGSKIMWAVLHFHLWHVYKGI